MLSMFIGAAFGIATHIDPVASAGVFGGLSFTMPIFLPEGIASAVVLKSAYEAELIRGLKSIKDDFLSRIRDRSDLVGYDVIDLTKAGARPNVLIDNSVYPIAAAQRIDEGFKLYLRKLTTEVSIITEDELYALPYDKKGSIVEDHKKSLQESYRALALYSFCAATNSATTPVLSTTGADDGTGRKRLTKADLVSFRTKLNNLGVSACDLVLCNEHVEDILLWSEAFEKQYQIISTGLVVQMFGFFLSQNQGYAPTFNGANKAAFGAAPAVGDVHVSVAYPAENMIKAYGSVKMYAKEPDPRYQQAEVNFNAYFIAVPKNNEGTGVIKSGTV